MTINQNNNSSTLPENYATINLTDNNISKLAMQILYYKEQNYNTFLIEYEYENLDSHSHEKIAQKLRDQIITIVNNHNSIIYISGLPICIFEKEILKPEDKWKYENNIKYYFDPNKPKLLNYETCIRCRFYDNCPGNNENYINKISETREPILQNQALSEIYQIELEKIKNSQLKTTALELLEDFSQETIYQRKRLLLVDEIKTPGKINEISYLIQNRKDDSEKLIILLNKYFKKEYVLFLEKYLIKSPQISIRFASTETYFSKSIYFTTSELNFEELNDIAEFLKLEIENIKNLNGIRVIFENENYIGTETIYMHSELQVPNAKKYFEQFELENRKHILKFLNSLTKSLKNCAIAYKHENNEITSGRLNVLFEDNYFKLNALSVLFAKNINYLDKYTTYTIDLATSKYEENTIKISYEPVLIEEEEEIEEEISEN